MKNAISLLVLGLAFAAPLAAQEVHVDYDRTGRFSWYKTFAWAESEETSLKGHYDLMHSRIKNAIEHHLSQGRLVENNEDPDLYVTYHASSCEAVSINTTNFGYGYGPGWYWGGGMGTSTTQVRTYTVGTLIVDIWDAKAKELVWRGIASDTLSEDPQKNQKIAAKALAKMFERYPPAGS